LRNLKKRKERATQKMRDKKKGREEGIKMKKRNELETSGGKLKR